ncbi:MAG: NAD(P)-dependent alcohol dehydrogenase [Sphingomonas sp.]|uniref:NAD(P)-dependent alcohol dehydrogenase n=1 Tax=Sphingomonas sp. TaxID=28214 RepID=UPI0022762B57|nr:NAD(P)-dependent alcohol dehydrogenase [Sphingomonas sp.]MCX8475354.1 NAD(P)-dependent alcohol dehydrogenase [Sphingomonas sp.]
MKRVQYDCYGGPEEMYVEECALPPVRAGEVGVAIRAAAINPFDWKLRQGAMKLVTGGRFPRAMGTDFAGVVEAVGEDVTSVRVGDEVFGSIDFKKSGAFAEAAVVDAAHLVKKPAGLSFAEAACLPIPAMTAWVAIVDKARVRAGSRVFIHGCSGAVGAFAVQLARSRGAQVSGACGPASRVGVAAAGVDPVFDYADKDGIAQHGMFDAIFDTLGTLDVGEGLSLLNRGGVLVDINPTPARMLRGMLTRPYKLAFATAGVKHLPGIAELADAGILRPTVGREAPFGDALPVIAELEAGARAAGRTVLIFEGTSA